jgi:hypothetical protein
MSGIWQREVLWDLRSYARETDFVVQILHNAGKVNLHLKDKDCGTRISYAISNDHEIIVQMILDTGNLMSIRVGKVAKLRLHMRLEIERAGDHRGVTTFLKTCATKAA